MGDIVVREVSRPADHRAFWRLPYRLYAGDPLWVPPLRMEEARRWSPRHSAALRTRHVTRFLAERDGRVVGRITAGTDDRFASRWAPATGFFGFFESEDDEPAALALLEAAAGAARGFGLRRLLGPVNLTTNDEVGILAEGFDARPTLLSPYNPPWYERLLRAAGCVPERDYHAYGWNPALPHSPAIGRLVRRLAAGEAGVTVRTSEKGRWNEDSRTLFELYNAAFDGLWGFTPMSWEEFREKAESFKPFYRPELVIVAEDRGRPVGFALGLPDVNEILATIGGRLFPLGLVRLLHGIPRLRTVRVILLGVLPSYAGRGVAALLAWRLAQSGRTLGITWAELSLVQDTNEPMNHVIAAMGGRRCKTFRLFARDVRP
jgi:GNAT superfamily N-acetyltransferase